MIVKDHKIHHPKNSNKVSSILNPCPPPNLCFCPAAMNGNDSIKVHERTASDATSDSFVMSELLSPLSEQSSNPTPAREVTSPDTG